MRTSDEIRIGCRLIDAELDRGPAKLSPEAEEHLRQCERCSRVYLFFLEKRPFQEASPDRLLDIQSELQRSLRPVTPQPAPRVLAIRLLIAFLLFAAPAIVMMGAAGLRDMTWMQRVVMLAVLTFGAGLLSMSLAWQVSPGSLRRIPPYVAILSLTAGFLLGLAILFPWQAPQAFLTRGWICLKAGLLLAVPAGALFWILVRRGRAFGVGMLGATLGAIAGLLGAFVLQFHCNIQDAGHLLVWHGGILILSIGLGILAAGGIEKLATRRR